MLEDGYCDMEIHTIMATGKKTILDKNILFTVNLKLYD